MCNTLTSTENTNNKDNVTLIWFDSNIDSNPDIKKTKFELQRISGQLQCYTDLIQCVKFIQSNEQEIIFLITSGTIASTLLAPVTSLRQVESIFIFCMRKSKYKVLMKKHLKIKGIFTTQTHLCQSIREQIALVEKHIQTFSFFDQRQKHTRDLSKESDTFLWFQLFNYVITRFPRNEQAKKEMIDMCKEYYRRSMKDLQLIQQFEQEYRPEDAIRWYSKQTFVYKLVNKALRTEDINLLYTFRFFIGDLTEALRREHRRLLRSKEKILKVYRGVILTQNEFDKLKENQSQLISTNGYLSTSRRRQSALAYAQRQIKQTDRVRVLFEIQCDVKAIGRSVIFADISELSEYPQEDEVLFDVNACFQIESIEQQDEIQVIKMNVSNEGETITKSFIEEAGREAEEQSIAIVFGRLMCDLGEYDKSQTYFEQLLKNPNSEDPAWIEFNIGRVLYHKRQLKEARIYYDRAYKHMMNETSVRMKDSSHVKNNIGNILFNQGNYHEALKYHGQALKLREKYYPSGDVHVAHSLNNIGNIYYQQKKFIEALDYYQRALKIYQEYYSSGHDNLAKCFNNIGIVLLDQGKYDQALDYHQKALKINEKYYSSTHVNIAKNLNNLAICYEQQNAIDIALEYYRRALSMYEKCLSTDHIDRIQTEQNIERLIRKKSE